MALKLGSGNINKLYLGSTEAQKAYLGNSLVFDVGGSAVTVLGSEFSDFGNLRSPGATPSTSITIPADCTAVVCLVVNCFREVRGSYTAIAGTLGAEALTVVVDSGAVSGFSISTHILALTTSIPTGSQTLTIDRPGSAIAGSLHIATYYLAGADANTVNWSSATSVSSSSSSLNVDVTAVTGGTLIGQAGPRRPANMGGATSITLSGVSTVDGFDDTPNSASTELDSLATKWGHSTNATAGVHNISASWSTADVSGLCAIAIPPA